MDAEKAAASAALIASLVFFVLRAVAAYFLAKPVDAEQLAGWVRLACAGLGRAAARLAISTASER